MTSRIYTKQGGAQWDGSNPIIEHYSLSSPNSPRVNGRLVLRSNPMSLRHTKTNSAYGTGMYGGLKPSVVFDVAHLRQWGSVASSVAAAQAQAYAKLRGKLYSGNASLGVTFASWRQSRDMIVNQSRIISASAEDLMALQSTKRLTRRMADRYLEVIFGWQPLLADIHAASTSVIQTAASVTWVRASSHKEYTHTVANTRPGWETYRDEYKGHVRVTYGAQVRIDNPNLWLAERAGLVNPLAVAWDLVPWSFVINMFSNVGSIVNSITDFAGLQFTEASRTETHVVSRTYSRVTEYPGRGTQGGAATARYKERTLEGPTLPVGLTFRVPELSWSTAAMAASLMVQQATRAIRAYQTLRRLIV